MVQRERDRQIDRPRQTEREVNNIKILTIRQVIRRHCKSGRSERCRHQRWHRERRTDTDRQTVREVNKLKVLTIRQVIRRHCKSGRSKRSGHQGYLWDGAQRERLIVGGSHMMRHLVRVRRVAGTRRHPDTHPHERRTRVSLEQLS